MAILGTTIYLAGDVSRKMLLETETIAMTVGFLSAEPC